MLSFYSQIFKKSTVFYVIYTIARKIFIKKYILLATNKESDFFLNLTCIKNYAQQKKRKYFKFIKYDNNKVLSQVYFIFCLARSKILVIDVTHIILNDLLNCDLPIVIQLWHGGGAYKGVAYNAGVNIDRRDIISYATIGYLIVSSSSLVKYYARIFKIPRNKIIPIGVPRTDFLLNTDENDIINLKRIYNIPLYKTVVLYAPTFRIYKKRRIMPKILDDNKLRKMLGDNFILLYRGHPTVKQRGPIVNDVTCEKYIDIVKVSDILITDYSSIIFDFALSGKKVFLFCPDKDMYDRNFATTPEELCGKYCFTEVNSLVSSIKSKEYDYDICKNITQTHMSECLGNSTERITNFMEEVYLK